jgi:hypothetical protein
VALTARPSHPGLGAARAQGAGRRAAGRAAPGLAGRAAPGPPGLAVCRVCQHTASQHTASQHTASQHTAMCVCVSCVSLWLYGTHGTHLRPCGQCGQCVPLFSNWGRAPNVDSYTIHTVIIYSIYIFKRPIQIHDTQGTQWGFFREPDHIRAVTHTITHADTHIPGFPLM